MFEKYLMLAVYFAVLMGLSYVASRRIKNLKDYFTGGKNLGYWVAAFSTQATGESAWLLLGLTGMGYAVGAHAFWVVLGEVLGISLAWILISVEHLLLKITVKAGVKLVGYLLPLQLSGQLILFIPSQ